MEFGQNKILWNWFIWFHEFFCLSKIETISEKNQTKFLIFSHGCCHYLHTAHFSCSQNHNKINVANMEQAGNFPNTIFYSTLTSRGLSSTKKKYIQQQCFHNIGEREWVPERDQTTIFGYNYGAIYRLITFFSNFWWFHKI